MPYYFGEDSPGWDAYMDELEAADGVTGNAPLDRFTYIEPWEAKTAVLRFARNPGPLKGAGANASAAEPASTATAQAAVPARSIFSWLFGAKPVPASLPPPQPVTPPAKIEIGSPEWIEQYHKDQKRAADEALNRVAVMTEALRNAGVARVFIRYDGGNDEGFTHLDAFELADGRRIAAGDAAGRQQIAGPLHTALVAVYGLDAGNRNYGPDKMLTEFNEHGYLELIDDAAVAFMGPGFGTGPFEMFGAITIDCLACTITDERDPRIVFEGREN